MLTDDEIKHIEKLAKIRLSSEARDKLKGQLSDIIEFVRTLQKVDTSGFEGAAREKRFDQLLREDREVDGLERNEILEQAPDGENGFFRVPPVIDKG